MRRNFPPAHKIINVNLKRDCTCILTSGQSVRAPHRQADSGTIVYALFLLVNLKEIKKDKIFKINFLKIFGEDPVIIGTCTVPDILDMDLSVRVGWYRNTNSGHGQ